MSKLGELLIAQLPKFDGKRIRLAEAIELTPSRLTRAIKGEYALDVRNCLRLALAAGLPATQVLQAAGKGDIAELIERAYQKADESTTAAEREHLRRWRTLGDAERKAIETLMRELPEEDTKPAKRKKSA